MPGENFFGLDDELLGNLGRSAAGRVLTHRFQWRDAGLLGVSVVHMPGESLAAEDDGETVLLNRFDEDLDAGDLDLP